LRDPNISVDQSLFIAPATLPKSSPKILLTNQNEGGEFEPEIRQIGQKTRFHQNFGEVNPDRLKRLSKEDDFEKLKEYSKNTDQGFP
jgi:hypothetical protein